MSVIHFDRLEQGFATLSTYRDRETALDAKFREFILSASDDQLNRINPRQLGRLWAADERAILNWLIYASWVGIFNLNWESHCPHCTGLNSIQSRMGALEENVYCRVCDYDFSLHFDEHVEVTFDINPGIRATSPSPQVYMPVNVFYQNTVPTDTPFQYDLDSEGKYFLLDPNTYQAIFEFDVQPDAAVPDNCIEIQPDISKMNWITTGKGCVEVDVKGIDRVVTAFWDTSLPAPDLNPISGMDVALLPAFQELFATDTLSDRESLQIRNLTIMFTDIAGSTAMYDRLGDVRAYRLVRDHFDILFKAIEAAGGRLVKTIGDATMAAFASPDAALQAALQVQNAILAFNEGRNPAEGEIRLKVGIHAGSAIAVKLNNTMDFFGNMVNIASRIEHASSRDEILVSEAVYDDPSVQRLLNRSPELRIRQSDVQLAGITESHRLYCIFK